MLFCHLHHYAMMKKCHDRVNTNEMNEVEIATTSQDHRSDSKEIHHWQ
jgi:hypothetical protein